MERAVLRVILDQDFESFDTKTKGEFASRVAQLLGVNTEAMQHVRYRRGCVIFECEVDEVVAEAFAAFVKKALEAPENAGELREFRQFAEQFRVRSALAEKQSRVRIVVRKPSSENSIALVHGWRGDEGSFGQLPEILRKRFACNVMVYPYPTGVFTHSPAISHVARALRHFLLNNADTGQLALVAHSMGGVVVRRMLANQLIRADELGERTKLVAFAASPKNGAALANIGQVVQELRSAQLQDLSPDSGFMVDLNVQWREWESRNVPDRCRLRAFYGTNDSIISSANAADYDDDPVPILGATHINIIKPTKPSDAFVTSLSRFLTEAGFTPAAATAS